MTASPRVLNIVTGPSGAGKSEFCNRQADWRQVTFNLDDMMIAAGHDCEDTGLREEVWSRLLTRLHKNMMEGAPCLTLDHVAGISLIEDVVAPAKRMGYEIRLWVICPSNPGVCVGRVQLRQQEGGHGFSSEDVVSLYGDSLAAASELSQLADYTTIIDSSDRFQVIGCLHGYDYEHVNDTPDWVNDYFTVPEPQPQEMPAGAGLMRQ